MTDHAGPVVFAAASTADVVSETAPRATVSVAASSVLARQIARGAPADVFVTADPAWIDWLVEEGVEVLDRRVVARGRLVIVSRREKGDGSPYAGRIAMGDPAHVPAGRYARAALKAAGRWDDVAPRAVFTGDVRAALAAVETGAADRAVVYASDVQASPRVRVLHAFPEVESGAVVFEAALLTAEGGGAFAALASGAWEAAGFRPAAP
jgi:molybdate transport system substrate-binding protein